MRSFQVFRAILQDHQRGGRGGGYIFIAAKNMTEAWRAMALEGRQIKALHPARKLNDLQAAVFDAIDQRIPTARQWLVDRYGEGFRFVLWRPGDMSLHVAVSIERGEDRVIYDLTTSHGINLAAIRLAHLRFREECPLLPRSEVCGAAAE